MGHNQVQKDPLYLEENEFVGVKLEAEGGPYGISKNSIQLSLKEEVNSGGYRPRREASRFIATALLLKETFF